MVNNFGAQWPETMPTPIDALGAMALGSKSIITRLFFVIYGTVMLELTVQRNNVQSGENVWSFGQIVAVTIALGGLNEVIHFFLGREWENVTEEDEKVIGTCRYSRRYFR